MEKIIKSKLFIVAAAVVAFFLVAIFSFAVGVKVGTHKALFSSRWGANYEQNFMGPHSGKEGPMGMMRQGFRDFEGRDFRNPHGLAGTIISVADNKIVVKDRDNKENSVAVTDKTIIKFGRDTIGFNDLKNDQQVVIMGNPDNNGVINADLIRVFSNNADNNSSINNNGINSNTDSNNSNPNNVN
jgi:hypothetical protein